MVSIQEFRRAKSAYNWLVISPILTIPTLFYILGFSVGNQIISCSPRDYSCINTANILNAVISVLVSALWHLILLQYVSVNDKNSEYVRLHGRRALTQAVVRTAVAFLGALDKSFSWGFIAVLVLIGIWFYNSSLIKIMKEEFDAQIADPDESERAANAPLTWQSVGNANTPAHSDAKETLTAIHQNLQSEDDAEILQALDSLSKVNFSSEAVRNQLERLALESANADICQRAFDALDSAPNRAVQKSQVGNSLGRDIRRVILKEIDRWEQSKLLDKRNADAIRRRYNFDFAPPPKPIVVPQPPKPALVTPQPPPVSAQPPKPALVTPQPPPVSAQPPRPAPITPALPPQPRPTLLQTLTNEGAIKIYLYLGAFFVIAAAAILGFLVESFRLPILFAGTLIFGGAAVVLKKRLPQPSFALFIIFSFLLIITANVLQNTMRDSSNLTQTFSDAYWMIAFFFIALVWAGSAWFYESRFFSIAAFGALTLSALRLGNLIDINAVYYLLLSLVALLGLAGVWLIQKWKDAKFALPLFRAAQVVQFFTLAISLIFALATSLNKFNADILFGRSLDATYLIFLAAWILGTLFYLASDRLQPSFLFPFLVTATLLPMPWFVAETFHLKDLGMSILLFIWSAFFIILSEALVRLDKFKKYSQPLLLSVLPNLFLCLLLGFKHEAWLGLLVALGGAILMTALHISRQRWAIWAWALVHFAIAYFAFFQLKAIQNLNIYFGYPLVGSVILFLLPDLILKKDWSLNLKWRLLPRRFSVIFLFIASFYLLVFPAAKGHVAALYFVLALLTAAYALAYQKSYLGYLPALYLVPAVSFAFGAFDLNLWRPALTSLAVLYYLVGVLIRGKQKWSETLRNSGLILGSSVALIAFVVANSSDGWLIARQIPESFQTLFIYLALGIWYGSLIVLGLLFFVETRLRRNGLFEIGAPIILSIAAYLILKDFHVKPIAYYLFAFTLIWLLGDLFGHFVLKAHRQLDAVIRAIGAGFMALHCISLILLPTPSIWLPVINFGIYAILAAAFCLVYGKPKLLYFGTLALSLFAASLFKAFGIDQWIYPVIFTAMGYYVAGAFLRAFERLAGWDDVLLKSGLGLGVVVSVSAFFFGGWGAAIPVAITASFWAFEAYFKRNVSLAFPANGFYLLAYFIVLRSFDAAEPQLFSVGTALFGLIQHYLLTRANSKKGAYIMGMLSQFILLGTTYIEMVNKSNVNFFFLLFVQSMIVLAYGIVIRSRSLTFFPIGFVVLGVITVTYSALKDTGTIILIGCTGILLLLFGIGAALLRERIAKFGERFEEWDA